MSFGGEITVQAESKEKAESQAYDRLAHLGQVTVVAFEPDQILPLELSLPPSDSAST